MRAATQQLLTLTQISTHVVRARARTHTSAHLFLRVDHDFNSASLALSERRECFRRTFIELERHGTAAATTTCAITDRLGGFSLVMRERNNVYLHTD